MTRRRLRTVVFVTLVTGLAARALADPADTTRSGGEPARHAVNWLEVTHITPPPQPPLAMIGEAGIGPVRDAFRAADGQTRIVMMMSPT